MYHNVVHSDEKTTWASHSVVHFFQTKIMRRVMEELALPRAYYFYGETTGFDTRIDWSHFSNRFLNYAALWATFDTWGKNSSYLFARRSIAVRGNYYRESLKRRKTLDSTDDHNFEISLETKLRIFVIDEIELKAIVLHEDESMKIKEQSIKLIWNRYLYWILYKNYITYRDYYHYYYYSHKPRKLTICSRAFWRESVREIE